MKITVLLPNGMFGYLTNVCNCDECKENWLNSEVSE